MLPSQRRRTLCRGTLLQTPVSCCTFVSRCELLPQNTSGRDFVVGDLHGQRRELERQLEVARFDIRRDRLFSVGDLVDRGPDSLETLALIAEPWFHSVLGNHEFDLLHRLGMLPRDKGARRVARVAGDWIDATSAKERRRLGELAERLLRRPLMLHVGDDQPFFVLHGDFAPLGPAGDVVHGPGAVAVPLAERATTSRARLDEAVFRSSPLVFCGHEVQLSTHPWERPSLAYAGHSPVPRISVHRSQVYLEQRLPGRRPAAAQVTLVEHRSFSRWLSGAVAGCATASESAPPLRRAA